ncbi:MAG: DUF1616 domain-containing protein [Dehalococcoidia bacterium]|nr:DUF1616 domain-containing protein [Dehalococcoidia bacterium]
MDLVLITVLTAILAPLLAFAGLPEVARACLGLPFLLLFPGYALVAAIFPRRAWPGAVERLALSAVTSLAVVPLLGIALNYTSWGVRADSILVCVGLFNILASSLGLVHRQMVPPAERLHLDPGSAAAWLSGNLPSLGYAPAAALGVLAAIALASFAVPSLGHSGTGERFTEFYLLGADGSAEGYPAVLTVGEPATVTLGIVNREGAEVQYAVSLLINESPVAEYGPVRLGPGQRLEQPATFSLAGPGEEQVVRFDLRRDGQTLPYRSLHLQLDGQAAPVPDQPPAPAPTAPPPEPSPPPAPPPVVAAAEAPPSVHVVSRGENLTLIARQYSLPLSELLAVNALPDPNLIYADQRISLPPSSGSTGTP